MSVSIDHDNKSETGEPKKETENNQNNGSVTQPQVTPPPTIKDELETLRNEVATLRQKLEALIDAMNQAYQQQPQPTQDQAPVPVAPPQDPNGMANSGMGLLGGIAQLLMGLKGSGGGDNQLTQILLGLAIDNLKASADLNRAVAGAVVKKLLGNAISEELAGDVIEVAH